LLQLKIQNVICTADLKQDIDVRKFNDFSWGRYDIAYYGGRCGYVKDEEIDGRVSVFLSGKMISTRAKSMSMAIRQLEHTMDLLTKNKLAKVVSLEYKIQNIVATLDLQRTLGSYIL
jgi:TATA-box binding protein (TBP) (component of TFIID and TFIIIB)